MKPLLAWTLKQGGLVVAGGKGPADDSTRADAMHYARMYAQDGPCELKFKTIKPRKGRKK